MASQCPLVLDGISLLDFVQGILNRQEGPSTLVFCGTREVFINQLLSVRKDARESRPDANEQPPPTVQPEHTAATAAKHPWSIPTLRLLATSRSLKLAFCPDITHLRAYLATYQSTLFARSAQQSSLDATKPTRRVLAILNPVQVHRETSAFSAQGLNRTFAVAVEAAHASESHLIIAECPPYEDGRAETDELAPTSGDQVQPNMIPSSVWDEEVSILNVTTKSFGAGERGWVGRTVKLRTIAERWFHFSTES